MHPNKCLSILFRPEDNETFLRCVYLENCFHPLASIPEESALRRFPSMHQGDVQIVPGIGQCDRTVSRPLLPHGALMERAFTLQPSHQSLNVWLQPTLTCKPSASLQVSPQQAVP